MANRTLYGTIYRWGSKSIKVSLTPDYTVPEAMLSDIDFRTDMTKGFVIHDPNLVVDSCYHVGDGRAFVLDELTLMGIGRFPIPSVLYTTEVLVQDPYHNGLILKSGPLLMRLPTENLQCKDFQTFMAAALR